MSFEQARANPIVPSAVRPDSTAGATTEQAVIVLVGAAGHDPELGMLLSELLGHRGVEARLSLREAFDSDDLLQGTAPSGTVHVFIVPASPDSVHLYFRAPGGERFLLRNASLRAGFDDVGRELIGQIVETAAVSLLRSSDGLTREQAQAALAAQAAPPRPAPSTARPVPAPADAARSAPFKPAKVVKLRPAVTLNGWLAIHYAARALGAELGIAHGPGFELGVGLQRRRLLLRGRVGLERDFRQMLETSLISAELNSLRLGVKADAGFFLSEHQTLLASLGVEQDRSDVKPVATAGSSVAPARAFEVTTPLIHGELRYETGSALVRVAVAVGASVSLSATHYDVARSTERVPWVRPWAVRPTASLALAFCPRWATF